MRKLWKLLRAKVLRFNVAFFVRLYIIFVKSQRIVIIIQVKSKKLYTLDNSMISSLLFFITHS